MYFFIEVALSGLPIFLALILMGWRNLGFWAILIITILQWIVVTLLPHYWTGWKKGAKQCILSILGLAAIWLSVLLVPEGYGPLLLAIILQTSTHVVFA